MACQYDYLIDIYDGAMGKSFLYHDSKPLLEHEHPQIWLQPFECAQYSVGIMYLICFKLPRPHRYHLKILLLLGAYLDLKY